MSKPQYIPDIPYEFKTTLNDENIIKPKNRFKNWKPQMRDLDSTFDVKGVKIPTGNYYSEADDLVNPTRRIGMGGRKLFMTKENGVERSNNFQSGY